MKTLRTLSALVLLLVANNIFAQTSQEQADAIVFQYIQNEVNTPYLLYAYSHPPSEDGLVIVTSNEEIIKIKYACWTYYLNEFPDINEPCQHRYLFVKEDNGNLLEIITTNDLVPDLTEWAIVPLGINKMREKK